MQIDYFTFAAQIVNFLVLIFLLRHFLYRPVIRSIDERERKIAARIREAEQKKQEAEQEAESLRKMTQEISDKRQEMLAKAAEDAGAIRVDLIEKAHKDVESMSASWQESVDRQKEAFVAELTQRAAAEAFAVARKVLLDLADENLEAQIVRAFIKRIKNMDDLDRAKISELHKSSKLPIVVKSTFVIPVEMQQNILEALHSQAEMEMEIRFEASPGKILGIEVNAQDTRISWSIEGYLDALKVDLSNALAKGAAKQKPASAGEGSIDGR